MTTGLWPAWKPLRPVTLRRNLRTPVTTKAVSDTATQSRDFLRAPVRIPSLRAPKPTGSQAYGLPSLRAPVRLHAYGHQTKSAKLLVFCCRNAVSSQWPMALGLFSGGFLRLGVLAVRSVLAR